MNEKVKQLWEKATESGWPRPGKFTAGEYDYNLTEFTKLIMQECAEACSDSRCGRESSAEELIIKHFGI